MPLELTEEQQQIIEHPDGRHAVVLAVAGSGKTTTMAQRIKHLADRGVRADEIRVLMFNREARDEFARKLDDLGMDKTYAAQVRTFHAAGLAAVRLFLPSHKQGYGDNPEWQKDLHIKRAVEWVIEERKQHRDDPGDPLDVAEAERSIELWKGALIPPTYAGYSGRFGDAYVAVYRRFEDERRRANALTFEDFTYLACLNAERSLPSAGGRMLREELARGVRYIIADEYQDVNYGQQRFVELLASSGADVMVVGDDDQTIYEWRGARSEYIRREFQSVFTNKPHSRYKLTSSFRFGFLIAQTSFNVITHNTDRQPKNVLTDKPSADCTLHVVTDDESGGGANGVLADEIETLVRENDVKPRNIQVLGRTYAQTNALQSVMMIRKIPFVVEGERDFLRSSEVDGLLAYIRVATALTQPVTSGVKADIMRIVNRPNRMLSRRDMERMLDAGIRNKVNIIDLFGSALEGGRWIASERAQERLREFFELLEAVSAHLEKPGNEKAAPLLIWLDEAIGYSDHYREYYGDGERSDSRINNIEALKMHAQYINLSWLEFLEYVKDIDTTLGYPEDQVIRITSIHRVKGREFDYVFIPNCLELFMPVFGDNDDPTFDKRQRSKPHSQTR